MASKRENLSIDLNADVGESYGNYRVGHDEALIPLVSSVNIACGFHAGDSTTMRRTVELAIQHDVAIGAHPGLPDLIGFGRREMAVSPQEVYDMTVYQVGALQAFVRVTGTKLTHVKLHGALYHMANHDEGIADAFIRAVNDCDLDMAIIAPAKGCIAKVMKERCTTLIPEMFADRAYQSDGSLLPRTTANSVIEDPETAAAQVLRMLEGRGVLDVNGQPVSLHAQTVCVHGDNVRAVHFAAKLRQALEGAGVRVERMNG